MNVEELETRLHNLEQETAAVSEQLNHRLRGLEQRLEEIEKTVDRALADAEYAAAKLRSR